VYRTLAGRELRFDLRPDGEGERAPLEYFEMQLEDFVEAILTGRRPRVDGREGAKSVALVEQAYRVGQRVTPAWAAVTA
jgi:predicted dehydrogenase